MRETGGRRNVFCIVGRRSLFVVEFIDVRLELRVVENSFFILRRERMV